MSIQIRNLRVPVFPDLRPKEKLETTFEEYSKAVQTAFDYAMQIIHLIVSKFIMECTKHF